MSVTVRLANASDLEAAFAVEPAAATDAHRRDWLARAFAGDGGRLARLAFVNGTPAGLAVMGKFFSNPFLDLIVVAHRYRRSGVAAALLADIEAAHQGRKLFVSTNSSNTAMQALLLARGYVASGQVDNLDAGDPELFFVRLPAV